MKTLYKYKVVIDDEQIIKMPEESEILSVQCQFGEPCIWAIVETDNEMVSRKFGLVGTGHPCERLNGGKYIGSFQMHNGSLVFHLFDFGVILHDSIN